MSEEKEEKIIERYEIMAEGIPVEVNIIEKDFTPFYRLNIPDVDVATLALLDDIKEKLIGAIEVSKTEFLDPKVMEGLKEQFKSEAKILLQDELPQLDEKIRDHFMIVLVHELLGLGDIEFLLDDPNIEEIVVNSAKEPIRIYHKRYGWVKTNLYPESEAEIENYASIIARRVGREISTLEPMLDAYLLSKDRANAILSPIATKGSTITIRKFARDPWTAPDFIENKTSSSEVLALIWLVIQYEMNMLISGGTGSGKTSFLNVCMPFIQPNHRIISIEDTRELQLPKFLYWCPLTTRQPNPEGKGEVTMLDLVVNSLRMRPDRIIMGEIRKQREAEVLFEAMHTGHSVYGTLHADTCEQTITRLVNPPINVAESMLDAVHLNVVMFRDRRRGIRRVYEVGEFIQDPEAPPREIRFIPNILYRWNPRNDIIEATYNKDDDKINLFERIGRHTGFTVDEINDDLNTKKNILEWLVRKKIRKIEGIGAIMNRYYVDEDYVVGLMERDGDPKEIIGELDESEE